MKRKIIAALGTLTIILSAGHNASAATKSGNINISFTLTAAAACNVTTVDPVFDDVGGLTTNWLPATTPASVTIDCGANDVPSLTMCFGGTGVNTRYLNLDGSVNANFNLNITDSSGTNLGTAGPGCVGHGLGDTWDHDSGLGYSHTPGNTVHTSFINVIAFANLGMLPEGLYEATIPYAVVF